MILINFGFKTDHLAWCYIEIVYFVAHRASFVTQAFFLQAYFVIRMLPASVSNGSFKGSLPVVTFIARKHDFIR